MHIGFESRIVNLNDVERSPPCLVFPEVPNERMSDFSAMNNSASTESKIDGNRHLLKSNSGKR